MNQVRVLALQNGTELLGHEKSHVLIYTILRKLGFPLFVLSNGRFPRNNVNKALESLGISYKTVPFAAQLSLAWIYANPLIVLDYVISILRCNMALILTIMKFRPTHIFLGNINCYAYFLPSILLARVKIIYRFGDAPPSESFFQMTIWKMIVKHSYKIIANSRYVKERLVFHNAQSSKITVIYNTSLANIYSHGDSSCAKSSVFPPYRILYVGSIAEHKGVHLLVSSFWEAFGGSREFILDIVGSSKWSSEYLALLKNYVEKKDLVDLVNFYSFSDSISSFYLRSTVHVCPSLWEEPLSNTVIEAKMHALASIVFPSGGLVEIINHKVNGYICENKTSGALAKALLWACGDAAAIKKAGQAALLDYNNSFGFERFVNSYFDIFNL